MKDAELILYRDLAKEELFDKVTKLISRYEAGELGALSAKERESLTDEACEAVRELIELAEQCGFDGNLWHCYLTDLLVNAENAYSIACELKDEPSGTIRTAVSSDFEVLKHYYDFDFSGIISALPVPQLALILHYQRDDRSGRIYNHRISGHICDLAAEMAKADTPMEMRIAVARFYKRFGVGKFGLHKSFRINPREGGVEIEPIRNIAHVKFDDLVGYEAAKKKLRDNTDAFVAGRPANNCLLFGDAGTGKSSSIKAMTNEYYEKGLRVIEINKYQFQYLNDVISQIKNRSYHFVIYMDDLSFEDYETDYKYLKAVIEGGLEKKPNNVLIYATSNRRHLIRENYSDKEDEDMHTGDTVQEKLSLAYRFGVTIYFGRPDKKEFQAIVKALAERYGIEVPEEELLLEANKWELSHGGLSGRTASQFIDYLRGNAK
ncbi:MAG: ATP-binding protein [Lachnospiraceae bacterium]|nr:ATP-binding protein [Lachnospiraceae bacterium]MBP5264366.1 ATP-binding protein [Lachnospiraceae bacterium]